MDFLKEASEKYNADIERVKVWDTLSNLFLDTSWSQDDLEGFAKQLQNLHFHLKNSDIFCFSKFAQCARLICLPGQVENGQVFVRIG